MIKKILSASIGAAFIVPAFGQIPQGAIAAETNIRNTDCPCIFQDNRVLFRANAPHADSVAIDLGKMFPMTKGKDGIWTVETSPIEEGFHYYSLVINGVKVADPASETYYGMGRMASGIDIPEKDMPDFELKNVPAGKLISQSYYSKNTASWRDMTVYTPPGYDKGKGKYPVLYIQHGGGEDHRGWAIQGRTNVILDNLIAQKKAEPMIVVMGNGNVVVPGGGAPGYSDAAMDAFAKEMIGEVIPFVEQNYRVKKGVENRALAGLSMGGGQSFYTGFRHPEVFGNIGFFSTGLFGGINRNGAAPFDAEKAIPGLVSNPKQFNKNFKVMYVSVGEQDPRIDPTGKLMTELKKNGLNLTYETFPGGHEWQVWRKSLHSMAQLLFKK